MLYAYVEYWSSVDCSVEDSCGEDEPECYGLLTIIMLYKSTYVLTYLLACLQMHVQMYAR